MTKNFEVKLQKILPKELANQKQHVNVINLVPDNEITLEKKGVIYAIYDLTGNTVLETSLIEKSVTDILNDSYFHTDNTSVIQAIEKTVLKIRDHVVELSKIENVAATNLEFNIAISVIWGTTVYVVQYGESKVYLLRGGTIKQIDATAEGKFSVASGTVKDGDIVIMASGSFAAKYPPARLTSEVTITADTLAQNEGCLMLKVLVSKELDTTENINFAPQATKVTEKKIPTPSMPRKSPRFEKKHYITLSFVLLSIVVAAFAISAFIKKQNSIVQSQQDQVAQQVTNQEAIQNPQEELPVIDEKYDQENLVSRVDANLFYDLKVTEENGNFTDIAATGTKLVVTDSTSGKIYVSEIITPKFTAVGEVSYPGITNLTGSETLVSFTDKEGYKTFNLVTEKTAAEFTAANLGITSTYLGNIYAISGNILTRYTPDQAELTGSAWATDTGFETAKAMGIDIGIFVLNDEGVVKYTRGEKDSFTLKGHDLDLSGAVDMVVNDVLANIYIADRTNKRLLVFSKNSTLLAQYKLRDEKQWEDLQSIAVSQDETKIYVLSGTKVFEVPLKQDATQ